jgi:hypothetical protein
MIEINLLYKRTVRQFGHLPEGKKNDNRCFGLVNTLYKGQTALKVNQIINEIWSTHQNESAKQI